MKASSGTLLIAGAAALLLHGAAGPAAVGSPVLKEDLKLSPTGIGFFDFFFVTGEKPVSISADSNTLLMGAALSDVGSNSDQGVAYVFVRSPGGQFDGATFVKLVAPDGLADDKFGSGAALSPDGNTVAVGSFQPNSTTATTLDMGAVYLFERNMGGPDNWGFAKKIVGPEVPTEPLAPTPTKPRNQKFGGSIQFSSDGNTLIVGDMDAFLLPDDSNSNRGAAYIFERDLGGLGNWGLRKRLQDPDGGNSETFGSAVAIDGNTAVVGALFGESAFVFDRNIGGPDNWGLGKKIGTPAGSIFFGQSVSVTTDGNTAAISANGNPTPGSVFVFERNMGGVDNWGLGKEVLAADGKADDAFGEHISFSRSDDNSLIVAAAAADVNGAFNQGAAYLFSRDTGGLGNWGQVRKYLASDGAALDLFGFAVARAGNTSVVIDQDGVAHIIADDGVECPPVPPVFSNEAERNALRTKIKKLKKKIRLAKKKKNARKVKALTRKQKKLIRRLRAL